MSVRGACTLGLLAVCALTCAASQLPDSLRLAYDYEAIGQFERAAQVFASMYARSPQHIVLYQGLRRNLIRIGKLDELEAVIKRRMTTGDLQAQVDWADLLYRKGQEREAFAQWHRLLQTNPRNLNVYEMVATSLRENGLLEEAVAVYQQARKEMGRPTLFALQLADLYAARLNFREATRENLLFLQDNPQQWSVVQARVGSYLSPESAGEIAGAIERELTTSPYKLALRRILGSLYVASRQWTLAFQNYAEIDRLVAEAERNRGTLGGELFGFAETARQEGAYEAAEQGYSLILTRYPGTPLALRAEFQRAILFKEQGRYHEAIGGFLSLAERFRRSREGCAALLEVGAIYLNVFHDPKGCVQTVNRVLSECGSGSDQARALLLMGDAKVAAGDLAGADEAYRHAQARGDAATEAALFKIGELSFLSGKLDSAVAVLGRLCSSPRGSGDAPGKMVNDALELLLLINEHGDHPDELAVLAQATLLQRQWQTHRALEVLKELVNRQPPPAIADQALLQMASVYVAEGRYQEAAQVYQRLYESFPESRLRELALKRKGELLESHLADAQSAAKVYEELLVKFPSSVYLEEVRKRLRALDAQRRATRDK